MTPRIPITRNDEPNAHNRKHQSRNRGASAGALLDITLELSCRFDSADDEYLAHEE